VSQAPLIVTMEVSMYPLRPDVEPPIIAFIRRLRMQPEIEVITNAMSTQVKGPFDAVQRALAVCMREVLAGPDTVVFVTKTLNLDLAIDEAPTLD
jgi:uncharacterized protein YqgV (UPF0045/DUF77 family)